MAVHADIPHQEVIFLDEVDPISSPMKAKGVGELGLCGVGAAIANAIYNATGVRVRDYPITPEQAHRRTTRNSLIHYCLGGRFPLQMSGAIRLTLDVHCREEFS